MRVNLPVFDVETKLREDQYLISRTDSKGRIIYANPAFVEISGFSREELIGKAHNIVRHPDMPAVAYEDLWRTLQAGKSWMGIVKNRNKSGGFYWVLANATPIVENGQVVAYSSVRVRPSDEQIAMADALYAQIRAGKAKGIKLNGGKIEHTGLRGLFDRLIFPFKNGARSRLLRHTGLTAGLVALTSGFGLSTIWGQLDETTAVFACVGVGLLIGLIALQGWHLSRSLLIPMTNAANMARQVAAGNLTMHMACDSDDEVGSLKFSLEVMRKSLVGIATEVSRGIDGTAHAATAIARGNDELSGRTQGQAASLQNTASSMAQLTSTVRQNAENARQANALAASSMDVARRGGQAVGQVVQTMHGIADSSRRIVDIVAIIEGIAFQTNILALNAAVEAARAGASGKGFAVVASEVRNLAQKSAQSAKEIKQLIEDSVDRVTDGSAQAEQAGATMQEIVEAVGRVTTIIEGISVASQEQSVGIQSVDEAVSQLDGMTAQNTTLVEQLGGAVHQLGSQSLSLRETIQVFRVHAGRAE